MFLHLFFVKGSIAQIRFIVDSIVLMDALGDLFGQCRFGPSETLYSLDVPFPFANGQVSFKDDYVLRPADFHRLLHNVGRVFVHPIEFPHPAHVARGETVHIGICALQMFRHGHGGAFFRPFGDQASDFPVQLHLRQRGVHSAVNGREQPAVVDCFFDVHRLLLSGAVRLMLLFTSIHRKEKRDQFDRAFLYSELQYYLYDLLIQQYKFITNDFIVVIMPMQPIVELRLVFYFLQKPGQLIFQISAATQLVLDAVRRAVGDDVVHLIIDALQILSRFGVFLIRGKLLFPPAQVLDAEYRPLAAQRPIFPLEVRLVWVEDTVSGVYASGAAHGEEGVSFGLKDLAAHQVKHMWPDVVDLAPVPFLYGIAVEFVKILMVSIYPKRGKGQGLQPVQLLGIVRLAVPYRTEITCDDHIIVAGHALLLREVLFFKSLESAMDISGCVYAHIINPIRIFIVPYPAQLRYPRGSKP